MFITPSGSRKVAGRCIIIFPSLQRREFDSFPNQQIQVPVMEHEFSNNVHSFVLGMHFCSCRILAQRHHRSPGVYKHDFCWIQIVYRMKSQLISARRAVYSRVKLKICQSFSRSKNTPITKCSNVARMTISAWWSNEIASKWPRFSSRTNCKRFQRS